MSFRYGFGTDSRQLIEDELGFGGDELDRIEDEAGFSLSNTFDSIEETSFDRKEAAGGVSTGLARTTSERTVDGVDVVLEYENIDAGTLAHEAAHATMKQPDGSLFSELPDDDIASQRLYGEFVAHLAQHQVEPLDVGGEEAYQLHRAEQRYDEKVDASIEEAYEMAVEDEGLTGDQWSATIEYQECREQHLAALAASSYDEEHDTDMGALMSPDEELYEETMRYIENEQDRIDAYL